MPSQGPIAVDSFADGGGSGNTWTGLGTSTPSCAVTVSNSDTNKLQCKFNAGDFASVSGTVQGIAIQFDAEYQFAGSVGAPTVSSVKISLGTADRSNGAALGLTFSTFNYGSSSDLWSGTISPSSVNGAWEIDLVFHCPGGSGTTTVQVKNVKATVTYSGVDGFILAAAIQNGNNYLLDDTAET